MQHNLPGGRQRFPSITQCLLSKCLTCYLHVLLHTTHSLHTWCRAEIWWHSLQQKTANVWFPQVCELHAHPPDRTPTQAASQPAANHFPSPSSKRVYDYYYAEDGKERDRDDEEGFFWEGKKMCLCSLCGGLYSSTWIQNDSTQTSEWNSKHKGRRWFW